MIVIAVGLCENESYNVLLTDRPRLFLMPINQGLKCKTSLLATCFTNNERLHTLTERVLRRPFGICAEPKPKLSLFLKIKHLAGWYNNALEDDMSSAVRNCLEVCC